MSTYATEFEYTDGDGDELFVNRCVLEYRPLMMYMAGFRVGVEMWADDVARLHTYLGTILDKVPNQPEPAPEPTPIIESVGAIRDGHFIWWQAREPRQVCHNTFDLAYPNREARRAQARRTR